MWAPPSSPASRLCPTASATAGATATLRLDARIGLNQPRYWFHVGLVVHAAAQAAMGACADPARPLRQALQAQGMLWQQHIGIVDGRAAMAPAPTLPNG